MNEDQPPRRQLRPEVIKQIENARLSVVETALVAFVEDVLGRVPTDEEILAKGRHYEFSKSPLGIYEIEGTRFHQFYCWEGKHVVAMGFLTPGAPLELSIVRVTEDQWPFMLKRAIGGEGESTP